MYRTLEDDILDYIIWFEGLDVMLMLMLMPMLMMIYIDIAACDWIGLVSVGQPPRTEHNGNCTIYFHILNLTCASAPHNLI